MNEMTASKSIGDLKDRVIFVNRVTKVVAGGKRLRFMALVVVGDEKGHVGYGKGKAKEVPMAIQKAIKRARKYLIEVPLVGTTIPHEVMGFHDSGRVLLRPASRGTGVIAGGPVRAILELAGVRDVLTKSMRSNNPFAVVRATFHALQKLQSPEMIARRRGKPLASFYKPSFIPVEETSVQALPETEPEASLEGQRTAEIIHVDYEQNGSEETEVQDNSSVDTTGVESEPSDSTA